MSMARPASRSIPEGPSRNAVLSVLLLDAVEALERDTERARSSLLRAAALVKEEPASVPGVRRGGLAAWQARTVVTLIDDQLEDGARVAELAAKVRLSTSHFSRAFKEIFGCSPQQFILERRIEHAKHLMLTTDRRLSDIAYASGFADQSHFSRVFGRLVGFTPNAWRRSFSERTASTFSAAHRVEYKSTS